MSGRLDLSRAPETDTGALATDLITRLAPVLGLDPDRIALAASPSDARRGLAAAGFTTFDDHSATGAAAFDHEHTGRPCVTRIGPVAAPICAITGAPDEIRRVLAQVATPPQILLRAGLDALKPAARLAEKSERAMRDARLVEIADFLRDHCGVQAALCTEGLKLAGDLTALGIEAEDRADGRIVHVRNLATAETLASHLGLSKSGRTASVRRSTKETDIALRVDLDGEGAKVCTGVHFFDHMLEQIARHGGIGLEAICEGDVEVDAHHTIEDVCLALGEALRDALGDKRGIARFGFETPMDETRAKVWIDLSGRPYARFDGDIPGERVGDFPVEMCAHAFRSLAETMKAAIHVEVDGENAHHMIESCFKSFGRALRMAKTIEGDALPSTKGVL
ncbi:MAG: imidazoleglycerol-phosphate dehydratase HisB [Oceanicaulis sp.]